MGIPGVIGHAVASGLVDTLQLLWESLYGLVLGFLISAIVQVLIGEKTIRRFASDTPAGVAAMAGFGIISSSCSYASGAVARSLYHRGAGARASFAYLISSTNMNVAILILFWVLVGWKFALAEFLGGIIIIAVVATGLSLLFRGGELERLRGEAPQQILGNVITDDVICGMKGEKQHSVDYKGRTYLFCNAQHSRQFRSDPEEYASRLTSASEPLPKGPGAMARGPIDSETKDVVCGMEGSEEHRADYEGRDYWFCSAGCKESFWNDPLRYLKPKSGSTAPAEVVSRDVVCGMEGSPDHVAYHGGRQYRFCSAGCQQQFENAPERYLGGAKPEESMSPWRLRTWYEISQKFIGDVQMLRNELLAGYLIAGFAEALVPYQWFSNALHQIGHVPVIGYVLLLFLGLAIAVATFVCSMGNVPVAQFLKVAGVPLGANTAYIYGDLLILPLVQIYRKSFAPRLTAAFLGLFVIGAMIAGGLMELLISHLPGSL